MNRYLLPIAMLLLGGCLGAAAVGVPAVAQEKAAKRMGQWEYKVVQVDFYREGEAGEKLNRLGAEGWELVVTTPDGYCHLKRPKGE